MTVLAPRGPWPESRWSSRGGERANVHAGMRVKAPILGREHRGLERRRDVRERDPVEPAPPVVHALLVDHLAVPIEQGHLGRLP